jgi:hypothetical protein
MPEEPSLLDYLKSRLKFWDNRPKVEIPRAPDLQLRPELEQLEQAPVVVPESIAAEPITVQVEQPSALESPQAHPAQRNHWPWRSLLALALALLAQRAWEPVPNRTANVGLVLYALSLAFLVWASLRQEWGLTGEPESLAHSDTQQVRRLPLLISIPLTLAAFLSLGGNLFTPLNVTLWVLAIICFIWAFWLPGAGARQFWLRLRVFFQSDSWQIKVSRWFLLVLVTVVIIGFFRIYHLTAVPSEPNSDHAEKILDVFDVSRGQTHIFFPRNTGREAIQMYLTLVVSWIFGTGLSFLSLKIGTVICGLATLPYMYLLGKELGSKRIGLLAVFFAGIAYWPNVISRFGLRFPLYPLFVAPTLYYLIRGLRNRNRNDFILSGLFLGLGLHGYTPFRIMPFVVVVAIGLYMLHTQSRGNRTQAALWLALLALVSFIVFLPLARYWLDNPAIFSSRAFSRLGSPDAPLPGPLWKVFLSNTWNALRMFNWNDGETWVNSVIYRPALDVVSGALFILGSALVLIRYVRRRNWLDLFLLLSIPLLELPSILSLAFPNENPVLSRTGGAFIPVFLIVALALDGLLSALQSRLNRRTAMSMTWVVILILATWSASQNYDLVFHQYADQLTAGAWNSSEMGAVIKQFDQVYGTTDPVWIVAYPYWVDTRLPGVWAGIPNRDFAIWPQDFNTTLEVTGAKLFMIKPEDTQDVETLSQMYPQGELSTFHSATNIAGMNFLILFVPSNK